MDNSNGSNRGGLAAPQQESKPKGPTWADVRAGRIKTWKRGADRALHLVHDYEMERWAARDAARLLEALA